MGLSGGVVGLFGGIGLSAVLRAALGGLGLPLPAAAPVVRPHTVAAALAVGLGATFAAAGAAAMRAARSRPLVALSTEENSADPRGPGWIRRTAAAMTVALGAFLLAVSSAKLPVALGALLLIAGAAVEVRRSLLANYVIGTGAGTQAGLDFTLARRIQEAPGVAQAAGMPCGPFRPSRGGAETVCGIDPAAYSGLVDLHVSSGRLSSLTTGTMAVSARVAARVNWHSGQVVSVTYPLGGTRRVRIAVLYGYDEFAGAYLIPLADYMRFFPPSLRTDQVILVKTADGARQQVHREFTALLAAYPQATLDDRAGYSHRVSAGVNLIATMMTGMLGLSLLIGLIAVATTLALSVLERTREIGLLRAVGAEARQIRSIVRAEALATGTTGVVSGVAFGLVVAWPLASAIDVYIAGGPGAPVLLLAVVVPAAIVASLLAAAVPARRAARLNILAAMHAE